MGEIRKAVSISRCTFRIHPMKTAGVRRDAEFRRVMTSWFTEFKMDAAGLAPFIAGTIGPPVASQLPMKRSRSSGGLRRMVRQSKSVHEPPGGANDFPKLLECTSRFF